MTWVTSHVGPKGQLTLPKVVRKMLHLSEKDDFVGFLVNEKEGAVRLVRMDVRVSEKEYSEEELRKMLKLAKKPDGKKFKSAESFLTYIQKL